MSWIKDVLHELNSLDLSTKSLRKFGITIGIILIIVSILLWKSVVLRVLFIASGGILFFSGLLYPSNLKSTYKIWMGFAFALGWFISRVILTILFIFVMIPIGFIAKIFGKRFLDIKWKDGKDSYWIPKENKIIDYEKMY